MQNGIEILNLQKNYGKKAALSGVSFSVGRGELFGLLGVNGAGKTTLIKILCGLTKKDGGSATIAGLSVPEDMQKIREILDVSPQETAIAQNLTVAENLRFFADIYGKNDPGHIGRILREFSLDEVENQKAKTLSGGWQRRLSIAIALISEPEFLFLDEPTLGLDVLARRELWKIILSLKGKITVVLTSHYLEEIEALCDRVAILAGGKVVDVGTVGELKKKAGTESFEEAFVRLAEGENAK